MSNHCNVVSVSIQKGGTGKTTVCRNLGESVSLTGRKVLIIDNDPQGNLTKWFFPDDLPNEILAVIPSVTGKGKKVIPAISNSFYLYEENESPEPLKINDNLYILGTSKHLAEMSASPDSGKCIKEFMNNIEEYKDFFDDIFIDCPPSAGTLQAAAHASSDYLVIPTNLDEDSINGLQEQISTLSSIRRHIGKNVDVLGIVINGKSTRSLNVENHFFDQLKGQFGAVVFDSVINHSVKIPEARACSLSIQQYDSNCLQSKQFQELTKEYLFRVGA